jgi:hypothetical protein
MDVTLAWSPSAGMGPGDTYEVWSSATRSGFFEGSATTEGTVAHPTTSFTDPGVLAADGERYYWVVPVQASGERGASTYSMGVWTRTLSGSATLGPPLRSDAPLAVSALAEGVPEVLGVLWMAPSGWVPHFRSMPAGVYDAPFVLGGGVQVSLRSPARFVFVGH